MSRPRVVGAAAPRRALLVGIDDYSASTLRGRRGPPAVDRPIPSLNGAVRDVESVRELLIARYGFQAQDIVVLENQNATRHAIFAAIDQHLAAPSTKDDVVLFYYSGHGSQVLNTASPEVDQRDESIVPADSRLGAPDIRDKELSARLGCVLDKGARLTIVLDSCHSGSAVRGLPTVAAVRAVRPDLRDVRDAALPVPPEQRGALVISSTQDYARAYETRDSEGHYRGAFSWAWLRAVSQAPPDEAAVDTFARVRALMRAESPFQEPVLSGDTAARLMPFLGSRGAAATPPVELVVEKTTADGHVTLQGGRAHGLTVGTELCPRGAASPRIRVIALFGLGRSEGQMLSETADGAPALKSGMLLQIATWAAPPGPPLRVWMPQRQERADIDTRVSEWCTALKAASVQCVGDPTQTTPTDVLRWVDEQWELVSAEGQPRRLGRAPASSEIVSRLHGGAKVFIQLPAPAALVQELALGPGTAHDGVLPTQRAEDADYVLVGRSSGHQLEYAWIRPGSLEEDRSRIALPPRTDWQSIEDLSDGALVLRHSILRLRTIMAWQLLPSPAGSPSPYRLALVGPDGKAIANDEIVGARKYRLVLRAVAKSHPRPRYYYVFGIDSFGRSVLLFPLNGSVENRFPLESEDARWSEEIPVGSVTVAAPFGLDTYVLLSADESLPNPTILEWSGVRTRGPKGGTPLEELLSLTGGSMRSMVPLPTTSIWSIDRTLIVSRPPESEVLP